MYWEENRKRLEEAGITGSEGIRRLKRLKWIFEYALPERKFIERTARLLRADFKEVLKEFKERVILKDETGDVFKRYREAVFYMLKVFGENCPLSARMMLKENFRELLFLKRGYLDEIHFVLVVHSLYSINFLLPFLLFELEGKAVSVKTDESVHYLFFIKKEDEGVLWIEEERENGRRINLFAGELVPFEDAQEVINNYKLLAERVFSSEKWENEKVILKMLESYEKVGENVKEDLKKSVNLLQAERMFHLLKKIDLKDVGSVPIDFMSYITMLYSAIIDF